jgi:glycerate dehydrogenase
LAALGECEIHDRTPASEVVARARGAEVVFTNKVVLPAEVIERLPQLRYIGVLATGYNVVDVDAARRRGIVATNVPAYGTTSVAQMVFAHLLNLTQHVADHAETVRRGAWSKSPDFCYWNHPLVELAGLTLGLVGFGRIGQETAKIGLAFGMKVIFHDVAAPPESQALGRFVPLDTLFRESDVVSLHCPLTETNRHLVNRDRLRLMKPTAFLINTSRGPLIDEEALAEALNQGRLAGAGLDVLATEPPAENHPLYTAKNCYITPHIAWATRSARQRLMDIAVSNLRAFLAGQPVNAL